MTGYIESGDRSSLKSEIQPKAILILSQKFSSLHMISSVFTKISLFQYVLHLRRKGYTHQAKEGMGWRWLKVWENIWMLQQGFKLGY